MRDSNYNKTKKVAKKERLQKRFELRSRIFGNRVKSVQEGINVNF